MKFKIGDKVLLLPGVVLDDGVATYAVGKTGKVIKAYPEYYLVHMDKPGKNDYTHTWAVDECNIAPIIVKGQQLIFSFMEDI